MHRISRDNLSFLHLPSHTVKEGDVAIFVFGEIDVRCHIGKQRDLSHRSLEEIIDTLVMRYLETIKLNRQLYQDLTCIVYSIVPPTDLNFNPEFPFYGSLEERVIITKQMNKRLSDWCHFYNISFLDIYDDYANDDGSLNTALSDGTVHIHPSHNEAIFHKLANILLNIGKFKFYCACKLKYEEEAQKYT